MKRIFVGCFGLVVLLLLGPWIFLFVASFWNGYTEVGEDLENSALLQSPPPVWAEGHTIKAVTFNIQDLPLVAKYKNHPERMRAIAVKLSTMDPDIVGFQESFSAKHRQILMDELRAGTRLQYFQYFGSGWGGSGMLTASAFPIVEAHFHRFIDANAWYHIWEGDWWVGKGVGLARVEVDDDTFLDFYNTHAQADYGRAANEAARLRQMEAAADFVTRSHVPTIPAIFVGDVNCRRGAPDYEALVTGAKLIRTMLMESRIDHIFAVDHESYEIEALDTMEIEQQVRVNNMEFGLSDHPGYLSALRIAPKDASDANNGATTPQDGAEGSTP